VLGGPGNGSALFVAEAIGVQNTEYYGGQAVIEGVMIRGPRQVAVAVRRPDGDITCRTDTLGSFYVGPIRRIPLLRGVIVLWETLALGIRALVFSSQVAMGEDEDEEVSGAYIWGTLAITLTFVAAVFFLGPVLLTKWLDDLVGSEAAVVALEGVIRLAMLIAYIWLIGLLPDIKRVFAYHGAEHRTINAYEAGQPLEVDAVRRFGNAHARCGTGFLLTVMVVAVVVFVAVGTEPLWWRFASRVLFLPFIASLSYEAIHLSARLSGYRLVRWLLRPSLALQALTTRDPDDDQIEVAITALRTAMAEQESPAAPS
jgi:uncharacterized protein YqhQ